ncbi:major facilitator superfamily domain-containing protein [Cadophora sp. MPI-SDFR-AT-0126]|nr:major facilitator superfamily domain-containing protein [Leotiomycetes sp. MPI-SDFR-AT-0126]
MKDIIRDSTIGQIVRLLTSNRTFLYPEEEPSFKCPRGYNDNTALPEAVIRERTRSFFSTASNPHSFYVDNGEAFTTPESKTEDGSAQENIDNGDATDLERANTAKLVRTRSRPILPSKSVDGTILVDWYMTDDPEYPQNWSTGKKLYVSFQICIYSFAVYVGSSIYSPALGGVMDDFKVSAVTGLLGLALYVLAYGIGPMLFAPLSEIPAIGRTPIYVWTFVLFVILQVPTGLVDNFAGLLVLRFLAGFFGSPCLATGAATFQDMYAMTKMPHLLAFWAGAVTLGPALAPIVAGFSISAKDWHWFAWEELWLSGPICLMMFISLPETSASNILLRRARRLRKLTNRPNLRSQSEIDQADMTAGDVAYDALIKPWQINLLDPAVAFTTVYTALVYGIFYSFFESFPLVFPVIYGFNLGESQLPFLAVVVSLLFCIPPYCYYYYYIVEPRVKISGFGPPEERLIPGLIATFFVPAGLFLFAWTSSHSIHWMAPTIGVFLVMIGCYTIMQAIFLYLPFTYPQYAASLFAANDFARSAFAAGATEFSGPMFHNLGVAKGCSLLGGLTVGCTVLFYCLFFFGANLRKRSRFAVK